MDLLRIGRGLGLVTLDDIVKRPTIMLRIGRGLGLVTLQVMKNEGEQ